MMKITGLFLFFIFSSSAWADLKGKLTIREPNVKQGQIVIGQIQIKRDDVSFILQESDLEDKKLSPSLYVLKPLWVKVSENNADIIEAEVLLVVLDNLYQDVPQILTLLQEKVIFETNMFSQVEIYKKQPPQDLIYLPFGLSIPMNPQLRMGLMLGGGLLSLFLLVFLIKYYRRKKEKALLEATRKQRFDLWRKKFISAQKRTDFEAIYHNRKEWKDFILDATAIKSYNDKVAEHQYRPDWDEMVFKDIKLYHERLLSMLKENR